MCSEERSSISSQLPIQLTVNFTSLIRYGSDSFGSRGMQGLIIFSPGIDGHSDSGCVRVTLSLIIA